MSENLGLWELSDREYYSFVIGHAKSDEAYFTHIVNDLNIQPREALFIDDRPENVEAAQSVGIQAAVYSLADSSTALASVLSGFGVTP
jgi:putative hydrolase of the HAD superfamily